jgi:hypothetical protein
MNRLNSRELKDQVQSVHAQLNEQRARVDALIGQLIVWEQSVLAPLRNHLQLGKSQSSSQD